MAMANNARLEEWAGFEPRSRRFCRAPPFRRASIPYVPPRCATTGAAIQLIREAGFEPAFCRTLRPRRKAAGAIALLSRLKEMTEEKAFLDPGMGCRVLRHAAQRRY